jgi:hypothetical protein
MSAAEKQRRYRARKFGNKASVTKSTNEAVSWLEAHVRELEARVRELEAELGRENHLGNEGESDAEGRARAVEWQLHEAERLAKDFALLRPGTQRSEIKAKTIRKVGAVIMAWRKLEKEMDAEFKLAKPPAPPPQSPLTPRQAREMAEQAMKDAGIFYPMAPAKRIRQNHKDPELRGTIEVRAFAASEAGQRDKVEAAMRSLPGIVRLHVVPGLGLGLRPHVVVHLR